jgi:hypothetical protein
MALINMTANDAVELGPVFVGHLRRLAYEPQFDLMWDALRDRVGGIMDSREHLRGFLDDLAREAVDLTGIEDENWLDLDPDLGTPHERQA